MNVSVCVRACVCVSVCLRACVRASERPCVRNIYIFQLILF